MTHATKIASQYRPWEVGASLFSALGVLALIVAGLGIYGVTACSVDRRLREMGIRVALGAQPSDIVLLVVWGALRAVAIGAVLGIVLTVLVSGLLHTLLYDVSPTDPRVMVGATVLLAGVSLVAALIPAARMARADPLLALKQE